LPGIHFPLPQTMKYTRCLPFLITLALPLAGHATIPEVSNIRASRRAGTKLIDIYYDVTGSDPLTAEIRIYQGGTTLPTYSLSGDVGPGVEPGIDRHIVWNAGQ